MPHSTYSKIYDILSFLDENSPSDIFELSEELHDNKLAQLLGAGQYADQYMRQNNPN